ncbi:T cell activation RhoGTPase activating protein b [Aplochiton taeniatus]
MKVLSGSLPTKTLTGGGMESVVKCALDGDAKVSSLPKQFCSLEDRPTQPIENNSKWSLLKQRLGLSPSLASVSSHPDGDTKSQLFGQPLCKTSTDEGALPKPIADMLVLLWRKGPSTEGVFRKTGNSKTLRSIREELNNGEEVDMEELPVVLLVGLLKSFLKELPGSLLVSNLYDNWMKALSIEENHQRVTELKRVVDMLPQSNMLLLQHLLYVLHHILESADVNKMDAYNLAVCIAPTLLQLDSSPLEEQKEKLDKVTELTQFLIEHCCVIVGENTLIRDPDEDNSDSFSSQHHDSAYDSTDQDQEADPAYITDCTHREAGGSSPSLLCSSGTVTSIIPILPDAIFPTLNRRCSEPIMFPSFEMKNLRVLARSHDDCSLERRGFEDQPLKKQISDDSFLVAGRDGARPVLSDPTLGGSLNMGPMSLTSGNPRKPSQDCSCSSTCSLESAASNQSEGSVFANSPSVSPICQRRAQSTRHAPMGAKSKQDLPLADMEVKRRSKSMRADSKVQLRTRSLATFSISRGNLKKGEPQKESPFPCGTLQEDSQSEAELPSGLLLRQRPLSAIVDSRQRCGPPSYERAVHSTALPAPLHYRSMTVQDAREFERRSRPTSVNEDFLATCQVNRYTDCVSPRATDAAYGVGQGVPMRQRAMSESVSTAHHETVSRRCSQPVFEEYSYAKESYV